MLENQIYSIESANINQETLLAMKNASKAMKEIHGTLTIDKVDVIMYVWEFSPSSTHPFRLLLILILFCREELGDQKALADEIGNAIANGPHAGEAIDEGELEDELATLEQEDLDEKMLKTGTVPVLPTGPNGERKFTLRQDLSRRGNRMADSVDDSSHRQRQDKSRAGRGRRRRRGATEAPGRDGHVIFFYMLQIPLFSFTLLA